MSLLIGAFQAGHSSAWERHTIISDPNTLQPLYEVFVGQGKESKSFTYSSESA